MKSCTADRPFSPTFYMDAYTSFTTRLKSAAPFLGGWFVVGFAIALWDPHPRLILTVALGISIGTLILGPYSAAALYILGLQRFWGGHLRWPLCLVPGLSTVLLLDYLLHWSNLQLVLGSITALIGTILGHDATVVVLELKGSRHLDRWMVLFFPLLLGLAVLAGYSSFGFGAGTFQFISSFLR